MVNRRFKERYERGDIPWDLGRPDKNLIEMVMGKQIQPCHLLEIGSGNGSDSIWLANQGFQVTGMDLSEIAVSAARERAKSAGVTCTFLTLDFQQQAVPGAPFAMAYDRGCFHSFDTGYMRKKFARHVAAHLHESGLWLTLTGSADDPPRDTGPPRRSVKDIVYAVERYFEILSIRAGTFDSQRDIPPRAFICLMKKRKQ